ncbi:MAG: acetyl ornithine aminotransferase family protein [Nitrospirae bacterium]|nr:acetyl ornithine aminotransferase family protein [Nitrospirota bacterium]
MAKRASKKTSTRRATTSAKVPFIRVAPPGPKARAWLSRDEQALSPSLTRVYPLVVEEARGAMVQDLDGNRFLDFTAGIAVVATGHSHPDVVAAIQKQAKRFIHIAGTDYYYPAQVQLAEALNRITPGKGPKRTFFTNSGAEAVEAAFKLARYKTRRPLMLAFYGGFHGRTMGALSLTGSKVSQRRHFAPLVPGVTHVPYANCYRCPYSLTYPSCKMHCVNVIKEVYFKTTVPPEDVAAIIVEPIQGEGGIVVPPPEFHPLLKQIAKDHGILYIADEVQTGMGRTGRMFASEHWGVQPDIITIGKGIASGVPMGATVASADVMDWPGGAHANTFGGNPLACEAALVTIKLIEKKFITNAARIGGYILEELKKMQARHRLIGDVRGKGLMIGVELVRDPLTKDEAVRERNDVVHRCFEKGLLLLGAGHCVVRFIPPLMITKQEADTALEIFNEVLTEIEQH